MSFGKKPSFNNNNQKSQLKLETQIENILNKNNQLLDQINLFNKNHNLTNKDIDHLEKISKEIDKELNLITVNDDSDNNDRYSKLIIKEKENLKDNKKKLEDLKKTFQNDSNLGEFKFLEKSGLLKQELDQYKVPESEIKLMQNIVNDRHENVKKINEKIYYLDKISKDIQQITHNAEGQLNTIDNFIVVSKNYQEEAQKYLEKTVKDVESSKQNKCCIILLIAITLFLLSIIYIFYIFNLID